MAINSNAKRVSVLVVDDDALMRELLKALLREDGFDVFGEARNGDTALLMLDRAQPDIVCLDVNMPGISGIDTLKTIRLRWPAVRVVMITGDASVNTVRETVSYGAMGYIVKPFKAGRIHATLIAAMKKSMTDPS
jgi:two-component system chemotaxis response regulator CheY